MSAESVEKAITDAHDGWVRLRAGDDWGVTYFAREPNTPTRPGYSNGSADRTRALHFIDGETVPVRWADGSTAEAQVEVADERGEVHDMGHVYETSAAIPYVVVTVRGHRLRVRIDEVELSRAWVEEREKWTYPAVAVEMAKPANADTAELVEAMRAAGFPPLGDDD